MKKELFKNKFLIINKGFTLIELLVVIAIIGILTAIVSANLASSKSRARDVKKISDIAQIQLTLEFVFDRCNSYPTATTESTQICNGMTVGTFISKTPTNNGVPYDYFSTGNDYLLRALLENAGNVPSESVTSPTIPISGVCTPPYYCVQSK
ncbi:MAG: type II secretion system protein [Patescibacteria group bacterium]